MRRDPHRQTDYLLTSRNIHLSAIRLAPTTSTLPPRGEEHQTNL